MTIISMVSLGTKKMYDWLHYSDVARGLCEKSERFSMENHQCQQEVEEVLG